MDNLLFWIVPVASMLALLYAYYFYRQMLKESEGNERMAHIAAAVRRGAMSYLRQQYKVVGIVFLVLVAFFALLAFGLHVQNTWVPVAFLTGGFFSGLAGYLGMKTATYASVRTANAARRSLNGGLRIAFRSGAVMGLVVVGLGLLDISFWYIILNAVIPESMLNPAAKLCTITTTMLTFGMGASTQALFARVGGGIYTKAADVGADLVGKVEAGIPEDDPRNPATIADNVGDNVGDVAGMGADLFDSNVAAMTSALVIAQSLGGQANTAMVFCYAALGLIASIIGIATARIDKGGSPTRALNASTYVTTGLFIVLTALATLIFHDFSWRIWGASTVGLLVGVIIGITTDYFTDDSKPIVQKVARASRSGSAFTVLSGVSYGFVSALPAMAGIAISALTAYRLCAPMANPLVTALTVLPALSSSSATRMVCSPRPPISASPRALSTMGP